MYCYLLYSVVKERGRSLTLSFAVWVITVLGKREEYRNQLLILLLTIFFTSHTCHLYVYISGVYQLTTNQILTLDRINIMII